jgi:lysophospholipase L1-like esterase
MTPLSKASFGTAIGFYLAGWMAHCSSSSGGIAPGTGADADNVLGSDLPDAGQDDAGATPDASGTAPTGNADAAGDGPILGSSDALDAKADSAAPAYAPCPAGTPCVIMPVGDSITAGYDSTTGGGYRLRLLHDIWTAQHNATFVGDNSSGPNTLDGKPFPKNHEGYSGYTIDPAPAINRSGISPLVPPALKKYSPHIVTLMIGTNDVDTKNDLPNAPSRLANLIDAIITASPNALLVVAQITPIVDNTIDPLVRQYNAAIPALVATRAAAGKHIILVDMYSAFTKDASYAADYMNGGLHPNDTGYNVMGDTWYAAIAPHL